ncbi:MAG: RluA family pseudouridine synthase [Planctomycetota bacterium]|nr:RluA family pseudouridine synthase [Planctomycetota bacterium]
MAQLSIEPNPRVRFRMRHEDADLLVVEKPPHVVSTPGLGHERDSLLSGLFVEYGTRLQNLGRDRDFGLLHRLDRTTSGLLIVALNGRTYDAMRALFEQRGIAKFYWAVCAEPPKKPKGVITRPIAEVTGTAHKARGGEKQGGNRSLKTARISSAGKPSVTAYRVLQQTPTATLIECRAVTGRLHQIRVHLESIGCPILGDELYAPEAFRKAAPRLALHAHRLVFAHPVSGATIDVQTPWPSDLKRLLQKNHLTRPDLDVKAQTESDADDASA